MRFFSKCINLETNYSYEKVMNLIIENTDLNKNSMSFKKDKSKYFLGKKRGSEFILEKNINYRQSLNPIIRIKPLSEIDNLKLEITFSVPVFTAILTSLIIAFLITVTFLSFTEKNPNYYIPLVLVILFLTYNIITFQSLVKTNIKQLNKILKT
ncbi:hypothetical protein [Flavobacterium sp.]|uniref:hypothetical protein n=1 Tax=Flavobacterium sp. TaxID=239 RepID=UPI0022CCFA8D|nr:hypothetical protein [Flavobacterium sp.]MCZ8090438.1 hypothetical protein [Flavobacterium sp.]